MNVSFYAPTVSIVCRWFQIKAGLPDSNGRPMPFNRSDFDTRLLCPLRRFMRSMGSEVKSIIVVSNGDNRFGLGECVESGMTPTARAITEAFPEETSTNFIRVIVDEEWGNNAGSAHALNVGWKLAVEKDNVSHVLSWNPELQMTGGLLARMLAHMEKHALEFVGAYRQGYWRLYQWQLAQNTACVYPVELLKQVDGFSSYCDGNEGETVDIAGFGKAVLAGMEDFDLALRVAKATGSLPRWGMVGRADPFLWDINFVPNTDRAKLLQLKIARQPIVMQKWVERHFPDTPYFQFMDIFFANSHED